MNESTPVDAPLRLLDILMSVSVTGLVGLMLYAGDPMSPGWWLMVAPFALWVAGPAITPWLIARRRREFLTTAMMSIFLAASSLLSTLVYYDAFFRSTSSTSALAFIFIPLYQWIALAVFTGLTFAASAWVERRGG